MCSVFCCAPPSSNIVKSEGEVIVRHVIRIPHAYVVFDEERKQVLPKLLALLTERGITSIGRYGAWEYSSMEKALQDGMEAAKTLSPEHA